MNPRILAALVWKDITLFFKNRFFAFITILGLVFYIGIYFAMPKEVDETLELAWFGPQLPGFSDAELEEDGLVLRYYPTEEALKEAVLSGDEPVGVAIPQNFMEQLSRGDKPPVQIYFKTDVPDEYRAAYTLFLEEVGFELTGNVLNIESEEVILGPDMAGEQVPPRQRMLPLLTVFILMIETWGLAALISAEIESGTLRALLTTPLTIPGLFASKGFTGVFMAFMQVFVLLLITGGLRSEPLLMLTVLLLGAFLVTGISFLIASVAGDMMSVMAWGMLALIVLAIPAFNLLLPGLTTEWIKILPSYYLVDIVYRVLNFGAGRSQASNGLLTLLAFGVVFFVLGAYALRRKLG